jgi:hypothetical protein
MTKHRKDRKMKAKKRQDDEKRASEMKRRARLGVPGREPTDIVHGGWEDGETGEVERR